MIYLKKTKIPYYTLKFFKLEKYTFQNKSKISYFLFLFYFLIYK